MTQHDSIREKDSNSTPVHEQNDPVDEANHDEQVSEPSAKRVVTEQSGTSREVFLLAFPMMISFLSMSLMGVVDTYIMGHVGTAQQGGVGLGSTVFWTMISFFTGTLTVVSTFVSQGYGAEKYDRLRHWVTSGVICAIPMTLLAYALIPGIPIAVDLMGTTQDVQPTVLDYMNLRIWGTPFILMNFILTGFLRGLGDTKTPMVVSLIANLLNVILDVLFVFGWGPIPEMGARGAALATVMGTGFSCVSYLLIYLGPNLNRRYQTRRFIWPGKDRVIRFLRIGLPVGVSFIIESVSWSLMSIFVASIDPAGLAAHVIVFQVLHVSFLPAVALSIATSTLVGQYIGAQRVDLAKKSAGRAILWNIGFMSLGALIFVWKGGWIISLFNPDAEVVAMGATLFLIAAGFQVCDALGVSAGGVLRGAGDTRFTMFIQTGCALFVFIPLIFLFGQYLEGGVVGAWLAALVFVCLVGLLLFGRYLSGAWEKLKVA